MKIAVIGSGAVGTAVAAELERRGFTVSLRDRGGEAYPRPAVERSGVRHVWRDFKSQDPPVRETSQGIEAVIIAVKAFDFLDAVRSQLPRLSESMAPGCCVVSVGNGWLVSEMEFCRRTMPQWNWRLGTCTVPVTAQSPKARELLENPVFSVLGHSGSIRWGRVDAADPGPTPVESKIFRENAHFFDLAWSNDARFEHRVKWILNSTINTIVGARQCRTNGELLTMPEFVTTVAKEAYALAVDVDGPWPESWHFDRFMETCWTLIRASSENENSMARDVRLGRKTESKWLAGIAVGRTGYPLLKQLHAVCDLPQNSAVGPEAKA